MSTITEQVQSLQTRKLALMDEQKSEQAAARACEAEAREHIKRYGAIKQELGQIESALRSAQVQQAEQNAVAAAQKAQQEAEAKAADADATLARLKEKEELLDKRLADSDPTPLPAE